MKTKYVILIVVIVLLAVIVAINWRNIFPPKPKDAVKGEAAKGSIPANSGVGGQTIGTPAPAPATGRVGISAPNLDSKLVLEMGSKGPEVAELQKLMNKADVGANLLEDGSFGPLTEAELIQIYGYNTINLAQAWNRFANVKVSDLVTTATGWNWLTGLWSSQDK